jgi:hypothetical protein
LDLCLQRSFDSLKVSKDELKLLEGAAAVQAMKNMKITEHEKSTDWKLDQKRDLPTALLSKDGKVCL